MSRIPRSSCLSLLALGVGLIGCVAAEKSGEAVAPPFAEGKADVGDRVIDRGPLAFGEAAAVQGELSEDLEFHAYTLAVRAGAVVTLDVTQRGSSRGLDTSLGIYGPRTDAGAYGTRALAVDDDSGWGQLSRLRDLSLAEAGTYLVVVGTYDGRGRGRYRLEARCESGECEPVPEPITGCHPSLRAAVEACVADWAESEPEWFYATPRRDVVEQCADIEVVAGAFDSLCAEANPPAALCALSLEALHAEHLPRCRAEVLDATLDAQCVFGDRYRDLFELPGAVIIVEDRRLGASAALDAADAAQVLRAVQHAYEDAADLAEAFASVDGGVIRRTRLWDASARRPFVAYEYGAGDSSYGLVFAGATTEVAAQITDGDLYECAPRWGDEMRECAADADCAEGLRCHGVAEEIGRGRCIDTTAPALPGEETACTLETGCADGLLCHGAATRGEGICRPAWQRGAFVTRPEQSIPDASTAGTEVQIVAYGLTSVADDVHLDLAISHPRIADLRVTLTNPAGSVATIFDGSRDGPELVLDDHVVRAIPGDEQVNGLWRLAVVDTRSGATGTLDRVGLTITSRWD